MVEREVKKRRIVQEGEHTVEKLILPTPQMVEWADCEMGVISHYDLSTYVNDYD